MSVNKAILLGFVGNQPEIRSTNTGVMIANFSLATSKSWKDKQTGEVKQDTEWHNISVFGNAVKIVENYIKKGSKLYIEGKIKTDKYKDKNGKDAYSTKIVVQGYDGKIELLDKKDSDGTAHKHNQDKANGYQPEKTEELETEDSDSIPF